MDATDSNMAQHWEEMRRRARQYENELDSKLFSYSKLMNLRSEKDRFDTQPLLGSQDNFERLSCEIDTLLASLRDVNNQMGAYCQQVPNSNSVLYTLQRHQEILHDYTKEFHKTRANIEEQLNRDQLFENKKKDTEEFTFSNRKNDFLLRENESIRSSENMVDDQIAIAIRTRDTLRNQRSAMKSIQTQLTTIANKFPMLNNVMHRIGAKKRKDSIILACVIAVCLILFFLFAF